MTNDFTVATVFSRAEYDLYGKGFIGSFLEHWPPCAKLLLYYEDGKRIPEQKLFFEKEMLLSMVETSSLIDYVDFVRIYSVKNGPYACARSGARKAFCLQNAIQRCDTQALFWLDADVKTIKTIPDDFSERFFSNSYSAHLGKDDNNICKFLGWDTTSSFTTMHIDKIAWLYHEQKFLNFGYYSYDHIYKVVRNDILESDLDQKTEEISFMKDCLDYE